VICNECGTKFEVNEGSGMIAMPFHCHRCGKEWWWECGEGEPTGKEPEPPSCECGGTFTGDAPPRCPRCRSKDLRRDPEGSEILYD
jgi:DNA-directed RNA polymerase subunit RPC12/RpoP